MPADYTEWMNPDLHGIATNITNAINGGGGGAALATEATLLLVETNTDNTNLALRTAGGTAAELLEFIVSSNSSIQAAVESGSNYINRTNFTKGFAKNIATTNATDVLVAPGASAYNFITHIIVTNAHATVGTLVDIVDETSGDVLYTGYAAPGGGGFSITLPTPIRQNTSNKKVQAKCGTAGADVTVSISGYKGA
jgi:hypothetical protein